MPWYVGRGAKRKVDAVMEAEPEEKKNKREEAKQDEDDQGQRVIIEHWSECVLCLYRTFIPVALLAAQPELRVVLNPQKPRRNSFEVTLVEGSKEVVLWTGIKKGPPRKLKFPDPVEVVTALDDALKSK
uniref:Selenoprotein H n=1 Tax=Pygocentrus nattereri TaxID=42514 RepID=A0A3B4EJS2_PYGNA